MPDAPGRALLCITPAPAIDRTAHVKRVVHREVMRPVELVALPGGKGVNAARAAARLGGEVITTGIAGGHAGRWIVEALADEDLAPYWSFAAAESRTTYVTVDETGDSVIVYERPGPAADQEYQGFLRLLEEELLPRCGRAIVAGSSPAGIDCAWACGHRRSVPAGRGDRCWWMPRVRVVGCATAQSGYASRSAESRRWRPAWSTTLPPAAEAAIALVGTRSAVGGRHRRQRGGRGRRYQHDVATRGPQDRGRQRGGFRRCLQRGHVAGAARGHGRRHRTPPRV